jgi:hypothetical protein
MDPRKNDKIRQPPRPRVSLSKKETPKHPAPKTKPPEPSAHITKGYAARKALKKKQVARSGEHAQNTPRHGTPTLSESNRSENVKKKNLEPEEKLPKKAEKTAKKIAKKILEETPGDKKNVTVDLAKTPHTVEIEEPFYGKVDKRRFNKGPVTLKVNPYTEKDYTLLERLGGYGLTAEQIAGCMGLTRRQFQYRMSIDPEIGCAIERGSGIGIKKVAQSLAQKAMAGDVTACIFFLKTQARWRETNHLKVEGEVTHVHTVDNEILKRMKELSPEQLDNRLDELKRLESGDEDIIDVEID